MVKFCTRGSGSQILHFDIVLLLDLSRLLRLCCLPHFLALLHLEGLGFGRHGGASRSLSSVGLLGAGLQPWVLVANRVSLDRIGEELLDFLRLEDVELRVGSLVYMQVIPVLGGVAPKRVVEVLALRQVPVELEPLCLQQFVVLLVREEAATAIVRECVVEPVLEPVVLGLCIGGLGPLPPLIVCRNVFAF